MTLGCEGAIAQPPATFHVTADEEHRVRAGAHGIEVEVWRRVTIVMMPIDRVAAMIRDTYASRAQIPLPLLAAVQALAVAPTSATPGDAT